VGRGETTGTLRIRAVVLPVIVVACALAVLAPHASAQDAGEDASTRATSVSATLAYDVGEGTDAVETPAVGVTFTVTGVGDEEIGTGETDADGLFLLEVPGSGDYTVAIDPETLPDGVELVDPDSLSRTVEVSPQETQRVLFALQEEGAVSTRDESSRFDQFLQLFVEGVKFGLVLAMMAVGLSLIFGTTGLTNFSHGEIVVVGTVLVWYLNDWGIWLPLATFIGMIFMFGFGAGFDAGLWKPLRKRGTSLIAMLVISIGVSLLIRYLILYVFRGRPQAFHDYAVQVPYEFGPITIVPKDIWAIGLSIVVLTAVGLVLTRTRIGKAIRAVADNPDLARSSGIDVNRVILVVWGAGASLATLGGVLFATNELVDWQFGFKLLLLMFAGVTLGGLGTAFGAFVGSLIVGIIIQVSTLWVSPELKNVSALGLLILILVVRPQGIFGQRERIG
jgi:branched-chain amino acid transport system permease protein